MKLPMDGIHQGTEGKSNRYWMLDTGHSVKSKSSSIEHPVSSICMHYLIKKKRKLKKWPAK
jgi:hypothetical protein